MLACAAAATVAAAVTAASASAHVELTPDHAPPSTLELFTVLSPDESTQPLTGLRLTIPPSLVVDSIADTPGYRAEIVRDQSHRPVALSWQGGRTLPDHAALFRFAARTPAKEGAVTLVGVQTFADGSIRTWHTARLHVDAADSGSGDHDAAVLAVGIAGVVLGGAAAVMAAIALRRARSG